MFSCGYAMQRIFFLIWLYAWDMKMFIVQNAHASNLMVLINFFWFYCGLEWVSITLWNRVAHLLIEVSFYIFKEPLAFIKNIDLKKLFHMLLYMNQWNTLVQLKYSVDI